MTDFDSIWRTQDEIRTVVNAVLGECIWNLSYNERRMAIELEHKETPLYNKLIIHESVNTLIRIYMNPSSSFLGLKYMNPCFFSPFSISKEA